MASAEIEAERARMLDERRKAGDDAWSPSRAREALRARICACVKFHDSYPNVQRARAKGKHVKSPAQWLERKAEESGAFASIESFVGFLVKHDVPIGNGGVQIEVP